MHRISRVVFTSPLPTPASECLRMNDSSSSRVAQLTTHLHTMTSTSSGAAPWREAFLSHISTMDSPEFVLSTIRRVTSPPAPQRPGSRSGSIPHLFNNLYAPRARTCVYRGLWADMQRNSKNTAPENPKVWTSDCLTFTTDLRMDKMAELFEGSLVGEEFGGRGGPQSPTTTKVGEELWEEELRHERGKSTEKKVKSREEKLKGSGGGAPVEACFWMKEPGTQWRVRGRAYVVAPDVESSIEGREVVSILKDRMRRVGEDGKWSFKTELTAHFGNLSPGMRGTFRNPPPGRNMKEPVGEGLGLGQKVDDNEDEIARKNFRVVVILPEEIDRADLSDPAHPRRWVYTFVGSGEGQSGEEGVVREGEWEKVEVWP
ncbi:pyridoxamine 5'-phosphate oxidase-domain-containing protein [Xylariaceae sp. FL1019]|nr:pyridoxamine 5'-phosphate oxidase-domain-containing protein [Xylariaceae sp. FL1019]